MKLMRWMVAAAAAVTMLAACGGGGTDRTKAQVRLVNASGGYAQLDYSVDGTVRQSGITYGGTADYAESDPGKASTISSAGSATPLLSFTPATSKNSYYTLLAYGRAGALQEVLLDDNAGAPDTNKTLLRVVNAAPDAGSLDIYLTGSDELLTASVPVLSAATFGAVGSWLTVNSSTWRLRVTAASSKTDVRLDVSGLTLSSKQIATLVLTPGRGGVLVNALLLNQQAPINRIDNAQARVRMASGMADSSVVAARVGSTNVSANAAGLAAVGAYQLLTAGTQTVVLSVGGAAQASTTVALAAGGDYTLLAYGSAAAPGSNWIEDDNHLPTDTSQAQIRLVNGVGGLSAAASMTVAGSSVPASGGVDLGMASGYVPITPSTTATVVVSAAGLATPLYTGLNQSFAAGAGYTVFALGSPTSPSVILRSDR